MVGCLGTFIIDTNNLSITDWCLSCRAITFRWRPSVRPSAYNKSVHCTGPKRCKIGPVWWYLWTGFRLLRYSVFNPIIIACSTRSSSQWSSGRSTTTRRCARSAFTHLGLWRKLYDCSLHHFTTSHYILKCDLLSFSLISNRWGWDLKEEHFDPHCGARHWWKLSLR